MEEQLIVGNLPFIHLSIYPFIHLFKLSVQSPPSELFKNSAYLELHHLTICWPFFNKNLNNKAISAILHTMTAPLGRSNSEDKINPNP